MAHVLPPGRMRISAQRINACGPISPAAAWSKGTHSHELVASPLEAEGVAGHWAGLSRPIAPS